MPHRLGPCFVEIFFAIRRLTKVHTLDVKFFHMMMELADYYLFIAEATDEVIRGFLAEIVGVHISAKVSPIRWIRDKVR